MSLTDKQLAGHQRRALRTIRERLLKMAGEWDGRDQFNVTQLTELADQAEEVAVSMVAEDSAAYPGR